MRAATHAVRFWGDLALFTIPHLQTEPLSYPCATPSAAEMMLRALYWKPEFRWEILRIVLLSNPRYWTLKMRAKKDWSDKDARDLRTVTALTDVNFVVEARLVLNDLRVPDHPDTWKKYLGEATEKLRTGSYRYWPHLGVNEYRASGWEYVDPREVPEAMPINMDIGTMPLLQIPVDMRRDRMEPVFFRAQIKDGILHVPEECYAPHRERINRGLLESFPNKKSA